MAENMAPHDRLLMRKIAHATRNARLSPAMSLEQAHAGMRAGMEIGDKLRGNVTIVAGVGVGSHESAALVLSRLTDCPVRDLVVSGPDMDTDQLAHMMVVLKGAQGRHREVVEPVEVLAAFGGFEVAVMVGVILMAASKRQLLMIDGMAACAALIVATHIAAWPLVKCAAALLTEVADGEDPGPTHPGSLPEPAREALPFGDSLP